MLDKNKRKLENELPGVRASPAEGFPFLGGQSPLGWVSPFLSLFILCLLFFFGKE